MTGRLSRLTPVQRWASALLGSQQLQVSSVRIPRTAVLQYHDPSPARRAPPVFQRGPEAALAPNTKLTNHGQLNYH